MERRRYVPSTINLTTRRGDPVTTLAERLTDSIISLTLRGRCNGLGGGEGRGGEGEMVRGGEEGTRRKKGEKEGEGQ